MNVLRTTLALSTLALSLLTAATAAAQPGVGIGWNSGSGGSTWGTPAPTSTPLSSNSSGASSNLEIGTLYVAAAAYGVGTGVWIDAEVPIKDPGLAFIAPAVLGVAAPVGVFFLDQPTRMPRGLPGSIAAGLTLGAGEGLNIYLFQYTRADADKEWAFRELARSSFIGATVGGGLGALVGYYQEPSPKHSLFLGSGAIWGSAIGTMFGFGASSGETFGQSNDSGMLGNLIGYNVGLGAAGALSGLWVPGYKQMAFMWMGAGLGFAATLPVYLFYAGGDYPARRGLIAQGIGTTLGIAAGGIFTMYDSDWIISDDKANPARPRFAQITGVGPMPLQGGMGAQLTGVLF